ncbi:MAG: hypothetical protein GX600_01485 [Dehalococcoidia bacterium]|nr:hypothetical protein [Dehalococcoidia bacterium]
MDTIVEEFLRGISFGRAFKTDGLTVIPLSSVGARTLEYIPLQAAMATGAVAVREVDESGSVGNLIVSNRGQSIVLALEGEELAGAKQNRILNTTVLLGAESETVIPVSCTEQGRWSYESAVFTTSESFATPRIRENAKRAVNRALAENRGFRANQGEVWDGVERLAKESGVESPTRALRDVVRKRLTELDGALQTMPMNDGQSGLMVAAQGGVLGFDMVSRPEAYAHLHRRLLRSYLMDARCAADPAAMPEPLEAAHDFLAAAIATEERRFPAVGLGADYRYDGKDVVGSVLLHDSQVIHAAFFRVVREDGPARAAAMRSSRMRPDLRMRNRPPETPSAR